MRSRLLMRLKCSNVLWFKSWGWGLTSQIRDYVDLATVSILTHGRMLLRVKRKYPHWCEDGDWLMCYFEPMETNYCSSLIPSGPVIQAKDLTDLDHNMNESLQLEYGRADNLLWQHNLFPNKM